MAEAGGERQGASRLLLPVAALFILAALVAVAAAFRGTWPQWADFDVAAEGFSWRVRPGWLSLAVLCGVTALLATGALWSALYREAGGRTSTREGVAAWLGSNLGRYLPGKIWQLTSIAAYARARGEPGAAAFVVSLALQAVILVTGAVVAFGLLGEAAFDRTSPWVLAAGGALTLVALSPPSLRWVMRLGRRLMRETTDGSGRDLSGGALIKAGLVGLLIWGLYGIGFWAILEGLLLPNPVSLLSAVGVFAAGYIAGYVVLLAPGGVVVREGAIAGLLGLVAGVPIGPAAAIALAARVWTTAAELFAFVLALGLGLRRGPVDP